MPFRLIAALSCGGILMLAVSTAFAGSPGTHSKSTKTKMHKSADVIEWREAGDPQTVVKGAGVQNGGKLATHRRWSRALEYLQNRDT